jgi:hypothetical protein
VVGGYYGDELCRGEVFWGECAIGDFVGGRDGVGEVWCCFGLMFVVAVFGLNVNSTYYYLTGRTRRRVVRPPRYEQAGQAKESPSSLDKQSKVLLRF